MRRLIISVLYMVMCVCSAWAQAEPIIEFEGNKYIIHVERLNPDRELTLLDVLHICPELMSSDARSLTADYLLSVDDIMLGVDYVPLLEGIKACDLSEIVVCTYGAVNNAMDGTTGSIDLKFKEGRGLSGKAEVSGSTYGNGGLFANISHESDKVTIRGFAQGSLLYGKAESLSGNTITSDRRQENAMLFTDWRISERDLLAVKLQQGYSRQTDNPSLTLPREGDGNGNGNGDGNGNDDETVRQRWSELSAAYERTLNDQGANLYFESGFHYAKSDISFLDLQTVNPWWIAEVNFPLFKQSLVLTAGYEGGYSNIWIPSTLREQVLNNDLYLMLNYKKGPWILSLGDRLRHNTFWDKHYDEEVRDLWSYNRLDHAFHASAGYRAGQHFVQGILSRTYFNPLPSSFHSYLDEGPVRHNTRYKTNLAWRSELRYTFQTPRLVATGSVNHTLLTDMPTPDQSLFGLAASVTWNAGKLRLTGGANLYHLHISDDSPVNSTYYILKLAPVLQLGGGFRLSSTLIYNSKVAALDEKAHLYASVKLGKDLGKHFHIFADFHDIAGQPEGETYLLYQSYHNRALTIGLSIKL